MGPASMAFMGAGLALNAYGNYMADLAQADAEAQNAGFYREQAAFAREAGDRQQLIFDRESKVLFGEQLSGFAKAGIDTSESSNFMAQQIFFRSQESFAIERETDMNVRLASLRADQADKTAKDLRRAAPLRAAGTILGGAGQIAGRG